MTHGRLLALAGCAPDGWLTVARETLAAGATARLEDMFTSLRQFDMSPKPRHFEMPIAQEDPVDRAVVATVAAQRAQACWVTMRDGTAPVYLVQADSEADLPAVTAAVQRALLAARERSPRVEVFAPLSALPEYHEEALLAARMLWSGSPATPIRIARTFDGATEDGPYFLPGHELMLDERIRHDLVAFLSAGEQVLDAPQDLPDVVVPSAGPVPGGLRSDGLVIWSDATIHYLDRHMISPAAELAAHAAGRTPVSRLTHLERHRVRAALDPNHEEEPLWRAG
ncbi:hypothetical protein GCM10022267_75740 [Lentzea roselyniae]|uniref:Uncharacterized protein n=1 Tax=Lentzea roselyniae TaxID=531940 RepID=A0ABP7C5W0_9PSEU